MMGDVFGRARCYRAAANSFSDFSKGARATPRSVTMAAMKRAGVTSNAGCAARTSGAICTPPRCVTSSRRALFDRNRVAGRQRKVQRRNRRGDIERDFILVREHGHRIRADLVRRIAIGRDAIRSDDNRAYAARFQKMPDHVVGDERQRDSGLLQLPSR